MKLLSKPVAYFLLCLCLIGTCIGGYIYQSVLAYPQTPLKITQTTEVELTRGTSFNQFFKSLEQQGMISELWKLKILLKLRPDLANIRSGYYEITPNETLSDLLNKLNRGEEKTFSITLVEGLTVKEWLQQLKQAPRLTLNGNPFEKVLLKQQDNSSLPEGKFFPNTFQYRANESAETILTQSYQSMKSQLAEIWRNRAPNLPLKSDYELLILASIIEKETGQAHERPLIASVFINRLRKRMRLQTDPTVIYGIGDKFNGNITRKDLRTPTAFNTYAIKGLPPTPIAAPSRASLLAAAHPAKSEALYFVSRNDGSHIFSNTLKQHNRAVNQYQRNRK
ncbi:endolytic transglycosylase MltG [Shewanella gelidii]|uniref:Endolytic murein transglycosylase n=1 Tax=Shewanella gelidii TaxID=1642821 RepID=A0A917JWN4_9GAMM|nr:endolytic transglycosylase MltG [Shewanella gelidii]MCL1099021.1 endolytic transglycosylase MltG [Shewanella gelidii]GGI88792.1 aminodeoxychorismate lyase [Shewanella gelidii]